MALLGSRCRVRGADPEVEIGEDDREHEFFPGDLQTGHCPRRECGRYSGSGVRGKRAGDGPDSGSFDSIDQGPGSQVCNPASNKESGNPGRHKKEHLPSGMPPASTEDHGDHGV